MRIIVRANDPVLISFVEALFREAGIAAHIADAHMSVMEGSIGVLPRRVMVLDEDWGRAAKLLEEADLGQWIVREDGRRSSKPSKGEP
jgi:hypothetical protein